VATVTNHSRYLSSHLDAARQSYPVMRKRPLGATGLSVGEIGIGTAALAGGWLSSVPDEEACFTLGLALDMQVSLVDVSASKGHERVSSLVGSAIKNRRHQAQICLRVEGGPEEIRRETEGALAALGTGHVDVLLWDRPTVQELKSRDSAWAALGDLKKQGKALSLGVCLEQPEALRVAIEQGAAEVLQFPLNIFDQANARILDAAEAKGIGLIASRPLDSAWLTGRYGAGHIFLDSRNRWSRADKARRGRLQESVEALVSKSGTTTAQAALQFVLSFPQLSCVVASVSDWHQVVGNVDAARGTLDPLVVEQLKRLWADELQAHPLVP